MSVVLLAGVGLEFGQGGVYPELRTRLHGVFFVVVSTSQKQQKTVVKRDRKSALVPPLKCDMKWTSILGIECLYSPR